MHYRSEKVFLNTTRRTNFNDELRMGHRQVPPCIGVANKILVHADELDDFLFEALKAVLVAEQKERRPILDRRFDQDAVLTQRT